MSADAAPPVSLRLAHQMPGRVRLRTIQPADANEIAALVDRIAAVPGLTRVVGRPQTGSIIVEGSGAEGEIARLLQEHGAARIVTNQSHFAPPIDQALQFGVAKLDYEIASHTAKSLRLHSLLALLLLAAAAVQLARGQIAGPATTLLMSALSLLEQPQR
ncbi:hypothetical protein [Amorphus sp. 3PC139-8]|uniref:hypothetical protein n=1 Tax=Amorphus sp. 3PC139-8 TaxID=2735676 RepID=UPI00345D7141